MKRLKPEEIMRIARIVQVGLEAFIKLPDEVRGSDNSRKGGYFTLADRKTGNIHFIDLFGEVSDEKTEKYRSFSLEKAQRVGRCLDAGIKSSWQSRDPENNKWGGAIATYDFILSFSGLPELWDEALMLFVAYWMNWINYDDVITITKISSNPYYDILIEVTS